MTTLLSSVNGSLSVTAEACRSGEPSGLFAWIKTESLCIQQSGTTSGLTFELPVVDLVGASSCDRELFNVSGRGTRYSRPKAVRTMSQVLSSVGLQKSVCRTAGCSVCSSDMPVLHSRKSVLWRANPM